MHDQLSAIVISITSDIAQSLAEDWYEKKWNIFGTYRSENEYINSLDEEKKSRFVSCDLTKPHTVDQSIEFLKEQCPSWDVLLFAPGTLKPIGTFEDVSFDQWEECLQINFLKPLKILHGLLKTKNKKSSLRQPSVIFFAGGGTNNAVLNYSGYTVSKIALIKMCELLSAEIPDTRFTIIGPGWVHTKIHQETIQVGREVVSDHYDKAVDHLENKRGTPPNSIIDCINWVISSQVKEVTGRNYSVVYDRWGTKELEDELIKDPDMYKLRRCKNDW